MQIDRLLSPVGGPSMLSWTAMGCVSQGETFSREPIGDMDLIDHAPVSGEIRVARSFPLTHLATQ